MEWRELRACDYGSPTIRKRLFVVARRDGQPIVWPEPTHGAAATVAGAPGGAELIPYRTAAECIDWSIPCPSIFERKRPLAEATLRRIANGVMRYVIEAKEPFIVRMGHYSNITGEGWRFRGQGLGRPLSTVTAGGNDKALVVPSLLRNNPGNPPRDVRDPLGTVTTSHNRHALVAAHLTQFNGQSVGSDADEGHPTITARSKIGLVAAFLAQHNGGAVGRKADKPIATITGSGAQVQAVTSHLVKLRGTSRDGQGMDVPMPTVTAGGTHIGEVRAFLMKYYGTGGQHQDVREPLHSVTAKARFGLVTIHGEEYQIADIGMRMLTPRELYRAQGFPEGYIIDPEINGKPLTKTSQIRMCGNSVCPQVAAAVVRANYVERTAFREVG